jgi:RNA recognition motif-containing protein
MGTSKYGKTVTYLQCALPESELMTVFIPKDFRGRCKGYAFLEFENAADCAKAIEGSDRTQYGP